MFHINVRIATIILTLVGAIDKLYQMYWSFDMIQNPVGTWIKMIGIIILVAYILTPNDLLQEKDR